LSVYFILMSVQRFYSLVFSAHWKFIQIQTTTIVNRVSYLLLLVLFILFLDKGLIGVVYAYVFSFIPSTIFLFIPCLKTLRYLKDVVMDSTYSLWSIFKEHGKWALFTDYFNNFFASVRPWIIGYFISVDAIAIFSVAMSLLGEIMGVVPLRQIFAPIIPRYIDDTKRFQFLYQRVMKYSLWFYFSVGIFVFLVAPFFVKIFFPQYVASLPFLNILLISLIALPLGVITTHIFYALKIQKRLLISTIIPRAAAIIFLPLLLNKFGLYWAAIVQVSASLGVGFVSVYSLHKVMPNIKISLKELIKFDYDDSLLLRRIFGAKFNPNKKN